MFCLHCNSETVNPKFCCSSCSASFNNKGIRRHGGEHSCLSCGETLDRKGKYCSNQCQGNLKKKIRTEKILSGENVTHKKIRNYLNETHKNCFVCDNPNEWNCRPLTLEMDHIDGDITNNTLSNVRLLCPNCHSQTDNFKAKNTNNPNGKLARKTRYQKSIK